MKKLLATFAFIIALSFSVGAQSPSSVGPPAVSPDEFYQPRYEYPADNLPSGPSLVAIAVIIGFAFAWMLKRRSPRD